MINLDKSYEKNYKYLYTTIHRKYDTQELIKQKQEIERLLEVKNGVIIALIIVTFFIVLIFLFRFYQIRKQYEKRFEELISKSTEKTNPFSPPLVESVNNNKTKDIQIKKQEDLSYFSKIQGINPQVVQNVLSELETFEHSDGFLNPQVTQRLLSEEFGTNSTYLSKIVNTYKGKNFNMYINDLRLDYILEILKNDWEFLNKDVKELSQIAGFSSAENFSDNFQRKFKIKPSYFIKKMKDKYEDYSGKKEE